jgi:transposase-like protein
MPKNKTPESLKQAVQELMRSKYFDFNMLHALEKIREEMGVDLKRETFRKWCHEIGLVKRRQKRRAPRARHYRERMGIEGQMLLMDGSPHLWFGVTPTCLIAAIDDATGEVPYAEFFPSETTIACLKVLHKIVEKRGAFRLLYVDRAGIYGGIKRQGFSQVVRALSEIDTHVIHANSPQAKGRVERLFKTLQDRLIPEMRLRGIHNMEEANTYLNEVFLPEEFHPRFRVKPKEPHKSAYRLLHAAINLNQIFVVKERRLVGNDHTISLGGKRFMIDEKLRHSIHGQTIELHQDPEHGTWKAFYAGQPIRIIPINRAQKIAA